MRVEVSRKMAKVLDKLSQNDISVSYVNTTEREYALWVSYDTWLHDEDYSYKTGLFKVLEITYPVDYYAMPQYATTRDLVKIFKNCDKTLDGFIKEFNDTYAI